MYLQIFEAVAVGIALLVADHAAVKLSEYTPTELQLILSVCHVVELVGRKNEDRVSVAIEEPHASAVCVLRRGVIDHDKVCRSAELLNDVVDTVGAAAKARQELVFPCQPVMLGKQLEILESVELSVTFHICV